MIPTIEYVTGVITLVLLGWQLKKSKTRQGKTLAVILIAIVFLIMTINALSKGDL